MMMVSSHRRIHHEVISALLSLALFALSHYIFERLLLFDVDVSIYFFSDFHSSCSFTFYEGKQYNGNMISKNVCWIIRLVESYAGKYDPPPPPPTKKIIKVMVRENKSISAKHFEEGSSVGRVNSPQSAQL